MPLEIYRRGAVWHCRGTVGPDGRRTNIRRSLRTTNKEIAARQAAEIETTYWKGHFDGPESILTFARAAQLYRAAGNSDRFLDPIEKYLGNTLVKDITEGAVILMAKDLYPNCGGASLNRAVVGPVRAVINNAAKKHKLCGAFTMERFKVEAKVKEPVTLEWINAFRRHAGPHVGALALFMYLTGARVGEALTVRWQDVDFEACTVLINQSKVDAERKAHLPKMLIVALANLPKVPGRGVFGYETAHGMRHAWAGAIERAGIKRLSPHSCRHGFATGLLRRGVDVVTVAWLGGWKSPEQVLKTYGHANKNPKLTDLLVGGELAHHPHTEETATEQDVTITDKFGLG